MTICQVENPASAPPFPYLVLSAETLNLTGFGCRHLLILSEILFLGGLAETKE